LEALLANEEVLLQLTHDALEDLILEKGNRLRNQLRQDFLNLQAVSDKECEDQQITDVYAGEPRGEEPVSGSNPALSFADSAPEAGAEDEVLTVDREGSGMSGDAVRFATDRAAHEVTEPTMELSGCGKRLVGLRAVYDDMPIPPIPQDLRSMRDNAVGQRQTRSVALKRFIVINGVAAARSQTGNSKARSPACPLKLSCYPRAAFSRVYPNSNIIPRAA
jgi:hypothetical protein